MSCRYTLDVLLAGEDAPWDARRHFCETVFIVFASLGVAFLFPTGAEKIFAVTGALPDMCLTASSESLFRVSSS